MDRQNKTKMAAAAVAVAALGAVFMIVECTQVEDVPPVGDRSATAPPPRKANPGPVALTPPPPTSPQPAPAPTPEPSVAACEECEKAHVKNGECEPDSGCDGLEGQDLALCQSLLKCMRATSCWVKDPLDCLCGTASGVACATGSANGDCKAEMQAATKTTDPVKNGTLFYDPTVPAGRANRLISCDHDNCRSVCGGS
jgi:hypothetical protein